MKKMNTKTKMILAFFAGILFLFLVNVGMCHNRYEKFENFKKERFEMRTDHFQNYNFENHNAKIRYHEMRRFRNLNMHERFELKQDSIVTYNIDSEKPINDIPILIDEVVVIGHRNLF